MTERLKYALIISMALVVMALAGCVSDPSPTSSSSAGTSAPTPPGQTATRSNDNAAPPGPKSEAGPAGDNDITADSMLSGTYTLAEVEHDGTVDMIKPEISTEIRFRPDAQNPATAGTFNRKSRQGKKIDHIDTGQYLIEPPDRFSLNILTSKRQVVNPPVRKDYKYTLSSDGNELRLTAQDGKVALFRRTKPLPEN